MDNVIDSIINTHFSTGIFAAKNVGRKATTCTLMNIEISHWDYFAFAAISVYFICKIGR